jgi:hypothetical protein
MLAEGLELNQPTSVIANNDKDKRNSISDYLLHRIYSFDRYYCNQFDIRHDSSFSKNIQILEKQLLINNNNSLHSYDRVLHETKFVYSKFRMTQDESVETLLIENRKRALVYQHAVNNHRRAVNSKKYSIQSPDSSYVMSFRKKSFQVVCIILVLQMF